MGEPCEYRFGNAQLRPQRRQLLVDGLPKHIGARAFDLLLALVERRDRVVRKDELLDTVWPGLVIEENNLQVHISGLRKLLGPQAIATIPGRGYRFTASLQNTDEHEAPQAPAAGVVSEARACGNLPATAPALYGREREFAELRAIAAAHRLVTVVGPGGIGKSVLSLALAHEMAREFPQGAWLIELAPLTEPSLVTAAAAGVLRLPLQEGDGVQELAGRVADRRLLVVLDNCEHLPHAASELAMALYRYAPQVRVLATSREPLKLVDEHVYRLGGLKVPSAGDGHARAAGSVALFEARAQAVDASFSIRDGELDEAAAICRHLDGIPLAIEFAAARVPLLGVRGLCEQLDDRFRVLTRGARLAQPRHQTLHAALEWSFALLDAEQQAVFRRLGVFAGSFGLSSAQRVASDAEADSWRVIDHLGDLVDKSLVAIEPSEVPRYRLLETTRAFALGKLADAGEGEIARRAHAQAMLELFDASCSDELSAPLLRRLARHAADIDNLRAALDWCFGPNGDAALGVALASASSWVWREGPAGRPEGMHRLELAFAHVNAQTPAPVEARLCLNWTHLASPRAGDRDFARALRSVDLYRALGDTARLAVALAQLGKTYCHRHEAQAARLVIEEQRRLMQAGWPPVLRARLLLLQGNVLFENGDYTAALAANEEAHRLAVEAGDALRTLHSLTNQEQCAAALGRWRDCVDRGHELLALIGREPGVHPNVDAVVHGNLCAALLCAGNIGEALQEARRARPLFERMGELSCLLDALATLAFERGFTADAARIMGCADAAVAAKGSHRERVEEAVHQALVERLTQTLPPGELQKLVEEGATLSAEAAASLALRDEDATRPASPESSTRAEPPGARQTHRERA